MAKPFQSLLLLLGFLLAASHAQTVKISFFTQRVLGGSACSATVAFQCTGVGPDTCCNNGARNQYRAVLFNGLPTAGVPAQGVAYMASGTNACGTSCNSGYGNALCLDCGTSGLNIAGAEWLYVGAKRNEHQARDEKDCVLVDRAFVDGHAFRVNYDVPDDVTERLSEMAFTGNATYADMPRDLLEYEVKDESDE